jgi:hypothetical protein
MKSEFECLESMLLRVTIPRKSNTNNRRGFPVRHRAMTLGETRGRFNGVKGLSHYSKKYPELWNEVKRIGDLIVPFEWNSCHINHNVVCPPHKDSGNISRSCIISFGNYTGCDLIVEGVKQETHYTPLIFDGTTNTHWNTNDLVGNRYSLVFYKTN